MNMTMQSWCGESYFHRESLPSELLEYVRRASMTDLYALSIPKNMRLQSCSNARVSFPCEPWSFGSMKNCLSITTNPKHERCMLGSHFHPSSFVVNLPKRSLVSRGSWMNRSCTWCLKAQSKFTLRFLCYVYSLSFFTFLVSLPVLVSCQLYCQDHNGLASEANKRKKIVSLFTDVFLQSDPFCNSIRCRLSRRNSFGFCWYQQILSDVVSSQI